MPKSKGIGLVNRRELCSPVDDNWFTVIADAKTTSATPLDPFTNAPELEVDMGGYTGVGIRVRFDDGGTLTTAGAYYLFGEKDGSWTFLPDVDDNYSIAVDDPALIMTDGTDDYGYMVLHDCRGCKKVGVKMVTAVDGPSSASLELTRF